MSDEITRLLVRWSEGDEDALDELMELLYDELRKNAKHHLANERAHHSLITGELINEVYLRLVQRHTTRWQNRIQFFAFASGLMRRVLVDHARAKKTQKRGDDLKRVDVTKAFELRDSKSANLEEILTVHTLLTKLESEYPDYGRQVELRYFAGLTVMETAEELGIARAEYFRRWEFIRHWFVRELERI